ncbi:hypothetical protein [Methylocella sp.]|uniref:hypothetical protein n=1 Tax=Methylocella sp. TaxID=1978226 RepID=UPI003784707D
MTRGRAGLISCSCDFELPDDERPARPAPIGLVCAGFAFAVLSQALAFAALPLAGAALAPSQGAAALPVAILLAGAAAATFPASFLTGLFGRRSSFALGASLGVAGAAIAAWSLYAGAFPALCLGAFWLGAAQGFGLYYRHSVGADPRAAALVLGAGALAAFAAPGVAALSREALGPLAPAGALIGAGLAQLCVLALAAPLPSGFEAPDVGAPERRDLSRYAVVTLAAALAWFGMMVLMAGAPLVMASCGLGLGAAAGAVSWHLLAMYAPAALAGAFGVRPRPVAGVAAGLVLLALAVAALPAQASAAGFDLALIVGGAGWALATLGATQWLHRGAGVSRALLALHDCALFCAAVLGALSAATLRG